LEREIIAKSVGTVAAAHEPDNGTSQMSPQLKEILIQISMQPFLVNLTPHLIKFVESKSQTLINPQAEPVPGDVHLHNLVLQVLRAVFSNKFFELDFSLKIVIPMLMNLTLCHRFHRNSSLESIFALKQVNAELLGTLIERFQHKFSLKVGYAEYLLQSIIIVVQ